MKIALREARPVDYGFARQLYRVTMHDRTEEAFSWDEYRQDMSFARQFILREVRIITLAGKDVGCIQTRIEGPVMNLFQFYLAPEWQERRDLYRVCLEFVLSDSRVSVANVGMRWPEEVDLNVDLAESFAPALEIAELPRMTAAIYRKADEDAGVG